MCGGHTRIVRSSLLAVLLFVGVACTAVAQPLDVVFLNRTGATIFYLYASPVTSDNWGDDLLGMDIFAPGTSYRFRFLGRESHYDIRAVDSNDNEYIIWDWDFAAEPEVTVSRSHYVGIHDIGPDAAFGWISIVNLTNYTIMELYIVPAGTRDWQDSEQLLGRYDLIHDGEDYRAEVDVDRYETFLYDIILVDEDGDRYIKREVNLELVSEVVYTLDDLTWE
jgi:hypothetical protein